MTNTSPLDLTGRSAIVTGATSGIGAAIAAGLARHGAHVVVGGRDPGRGAAVIDAINAAGAGRAEFVPVDLAGPYSALRAFAAQATSLVAGHVDILVNNAGIYPATATEALDDDDLDAMLAVNIRAPHVLVGEIAPSMAARGEGIIVNIGSWMAQTGSPFAAMYSATKAADEQLTRSWAAEYGPRGVRVNAVAPGITLTAGNEASRTVLDHMASTTPVGVVLDPTAIADGVLFLVSDQARSVHGVTLAVDGGIAATRM